MKRPYMLLVFVILLSAIGMANTTLDQLGCDETASGEWICPEDTYVLDHPIRFVEDVECYSEIENASCIAEDCYNIVNLGCFSWVELERDIEAEFCNTRVTLDAIEENYNCVEQTIPADGQPYMVGINPEMMNYAECTKAWEDELYVIQCPFNGKRMIFSGVVTLDGFIIAEMQEPAGADLGFLFDNLAYIIIALVIVVLLVWKRKPKIRVKKIPVKKVAQKPKIKRPRASRKWRK